MLTISDFFDIVAGVMQGDALEAYMFIIYLDYVRRTSIDLIKENTFTLNKKKNPEAGSRWYTAKTMTDADYADDLALLANTPPQAISLLHRLEQVAGGIGLYANANKTDFRCFIQGDTHLKRRFSKICKPVHIPRQPHLIYWKRCQYTPSKCVGYHWWIIDQVDIWSFR